MSDGARKFWRMAVALWESVRWRDVPGYARRVPALAQQVPVLAREMAQGAWAWLKRPDARELWRGVRWLLGEIRRIDIRKPFHAAMVGLILAGILAPVADVIATNERYKLTHAMSLVAERPSPKLMSKLRYDAGKHANVFNAEGETETKADMKDKLVASVGAGGKKDNQLYTATLPDDPTQGIDVHDNVNDVHVKFVPQTGLMNGRGKDGRVTYPLKDQDGQMIFTPKANGVKEDIVLMQKPKDDVMEVHYALDIPDTVQVRLEEDGSVGFYTATPELYGNISYGSDKDRSLVEQARKNGAKTYLMFKIPAPVVKETGKSSGVRARFGLDGKTLTVRASGLIKAHYPLSIDPTFVLASTSDFVLGSIDDNIDLSVANQVGRQALVGGSTPGWTPDAAPNVAYAQFASSLVAYNGFLYLMGGGSGGTGCTGNPAGPGGVPASNLSGCTSGTTTNDVRYICLNPSTGALGANGGCSITRWTQTSLLLTARQGSVAFGFNGYLYVVGGEDDSGVPITAANSVEYAKITSTGALSTNSGCGTGWCHGTNLNTVRSYPAGAIYQGVLYVLGGTSGTNNATPLSSIEYARINGDGTIGSWTQKTALVDGALSDSTNTSLQARSKFRAGAYNGFLYITGGQTATTPNTSVLNLTQYASIRSDGSLGAWKTTTSFLTARRDNGMAINNGYIYVFGGCVGATQACTGFIGDTQYAVINADGTVGQWQKTLHYNSDANSTSSPNADFNARMPAGVTSYSNHLYFVGGCNGETATNNCANQLVGTFITNIDGVGRFDRGISTAGTPPYTSGSTVAKMGGRAVALNGYLYYVGGCSVSNCAANNSSVEYAVINSDGTLGTFTATSSLPAALLGHSLASYNNKLYAIGGVQHNFPTVTSITQTNFGTSATAHAVSMPATVAAGDLLITLFSVNNGPTVTTPTGWTSLATATRGTGSPAARGSVYAKAAAGTEGGTTVGFTTSAASFGAAQVYLIPAAAWFGTVSGGVEASGVDAGAGSSTPDPPSFSPSWGSDNNLWLAYAGSASWTGVNSYPTNYTNGTLNFSAGSPGASVASARLTSSAPTEDPGAFSMTTTSNGTAFTIAVRPGGTDSYTSNIMTATQNSDGTLGSWSTQGSLGGNDLPAARAFHTSEVWHNNIYVLGGRDSGANPYGTIYYASIDSSGNIGSWTTSGASIQARWGASGGIWGNWLYVIGGQTDTAGTYIGTTAGANAMQRINIDPTNGSISSVTGFATNTTRRFAGGFVHNGFIYTYGGNLSSSTAAVVDISWAPLDPSTGAPGTLITTNIGNLTTNTGNTTQITPGIATARSMDSAVAAGGYVYVLGGCTSAIANNSFKGCTTFVPTANTTEEYLPNNGGTGQTNAFTSSALPAGISDHASVAYNGVLYQVGGCTAYTAGVCTANSTVVKQAAISPDTATAPGQLGSWTTSGVSLPTGGSLLQAVAYNGYLYVIGGQTNASAAVSTVTYTPINNDGSLSGSWSNADLPGGAARNSFGATVLNGYLYVAGGDDGSGGKKSDVYYARINTTNGSLGTWTQNSNSFNTGRSALSVVGYNGRLYIIGGTTGGTNVQTDVQFASQNNDGSLGTFTNTTDVSRGMSFRQAVGANGYMYFIGDEGDGTEVSYAAINANGTLGALQVSANKMTTGAHPHGAAAWYDGYFYVTGGCTLSGGVCTTANILSTGDFAGQQAISRTGHYSKLFDTQVDTSPTQLVINGAINGPGAAVEMKFQTASTSDPVLGIAQLIRPVIFGNFYNVQALNSSGTNVGVAKLYLYVLTLDDSRSGTFPDVPYTGDTGFAQTAVTNITLNYHANPSRRLRHGASFTDTACNPTPANGCLLDTAP